MVSNPQEEVIRSNSTQQNPLREQLISGNQNPNRTTPNKAKGKSCCDFFFKSLCCRKKNTTELVNEPRTPTEFRSSAQEKINSNDFDDLPGKHNNLFGFLNKIESQLGIIIVYNENDKNFKSLIRKIKTIDYIIDILKVNYIILPIPFKSTSVTELFGEKLTLSFPAFIFVKGKPVLFDSQPKFTKDLVIQTLQGDAINEESLFENLISVLEGQKPSIVETTPIITRQPIVETPLTNFDIIEQQKQELREMELMEELKAKEEIRIIEELKRKETQELERIQTKIKLIPDEPDEDNPDCCKIVFRFPDGHSRVERRFLKSEKIKTLYLFVETLGKQIFNESEEFDLIQSFPFKIYNGFEKTLFEEGMFPNVILQIREL